MDNIITGAIGVAVFLAFVLGLAENRLRSMRMEGHY